MYQLNISRFAHPWDPTKIQGLSWRLPPPLGPYYLATAYPFEAVDEPVRWTITILVVVCVCTVCLTIVVASLLTPWSAPDCTLQTRRSFTPGVPPSHKCSQS